jgi:hypothetical protein
MFIAANFVYILAAIFFVKGNIPAVVVSPPPGFATFLPAPIWSSAINKTLEFLAPTGVSKLSQGLGFDLPDALPGYQKILAHLLKSMIRLLPDAEPHAQHLFLSGGQGGKHFARLLREVQVDYRIHRRCHFFIFYEIT